MLSEFDQGSYRKRGYGFKHSSFDDVISGLALIKKSGKRNELARTNY